MSFESKLSTASKCVGIAALLAARNDGSRASLKKRLQQLVNTSTIF